MKEKSEASQIVKNFYAMVQTQFKTRLKTIGVTMVANLLVVQQRNSMVS